MLYLSYFGASSDLEGSGSVEDFAGSDGAGVGAGVEDFCSSFLHATNIIMTIASARTIAKTFFIFFLLFKYVSFNVYIVSHLTPIGNKII